MQIYKPVVACNTGPEVMIHLQCCLVEPVFEFDIRVGIGGQFADVAVYLPGHRRRTLSQVRLTCHAQGLTQDSKPDFLVIGGYPYRIEGLSYKTRDTVEIRSHSLFRSL